MARGYRDQTIDLELAKADLVEISIGDARRAAQRPLRTWTSAPAELVALVFERGRAAAEDARTREAVALSIDRAAIQNVLLDRQGNLDRRRAARVAERLCLSVPRGARGRACAAARHGIH